MKLRQKPSFGPEACDIEPKHAHMGPARALEESMGPARALEEREKFRKNAPFFLKRIFTQKCCFWPPDNVFRWFERALECSGRNDAERI